MTVMKKKMIKEIKNQKILMIDKLRLSIKQGKEGEIVPITFE